MTGAGVVAGELGDGLAVGESLADGVGVGVAVLSRDARSASRTLLGVARDSGSSTDGEPQAATAKITAAQLRKTPSLDRERWMTELPG